MRSPPSGSPTSARPPSSGTGRAAEPLHRAIVWQDTAHRPARARARRRAGHGPVCANASACPSPPTSPARRSRGSWTTSRAPASGAQRGELAFGTIDTWLLWNLTGGARLRARHRRDQRLAHPPHGSRNARLARAEPRAAGHPARAPARDPLLERGLRGGRRATALARRARRRHRSATSRPRCSDRPASAPAMAKNTYGTGCFLLVNTGEEIVRADGLLTTSPTALPASPPDTCSRGRSRSPAPRSSGYAIGLGLIRSAPEVEALARSVEDNGGVYFVPAFSGLFAPHWRDDARGVIVGLTAYAGAGHLARATLEAVAWQTRDVVDAVRAAGIELSRAARGRRDDRRRAAHAVPGRRSRNAGRPPAVPRPPRSARPSPPGSPWASGRTSRSCASAGAPIAASRPSWMPRSASASTRAGARPSPARSAGWEGGRDGRRAYRLAKRRYRASRGFPLSRRTVCKNLPPRTRRNRLRGVMWFSWRHERLGRIARAACRFWAACLDLTAP